MTGLWRALGLSRRAPGRLILGLAALSVLAQGLHSTLTPAAAGALVGARSAPPNGGVSISFAEAGFEFGGGANYRLNGPSVPRPGAVWVPVHVVVRNGSAGTVTGRVSISDQSTQSNLGSNGTNYVTEYSQDVALGPGARKALTLYVRAADLNQQLSLSLEANGRQVDSAALSPNQQQGGALSVGILSDDTASRTIFRSIKFGDTTLSVAQFSDATPLDTRVEALDNFDLIVLTNYSSDQLSAAQIAALRAWVQGGGTLLVAGGPDAQKTMSHLPPDLLAARLTSTTVVPALPELAQIAGDSVPPVSGPIEVSVASPLTGARVLAAHNGIPLAVDRPLGRGYLVYSALEPTTTPFNNWPLAAQGDYLHNLLTPTLGGPLDALVEANAQSNPNSFNGAGTAFSNLVSDLGSPPARGLPALQVYVFLIVLYILVLGPGNYIVLRWRRRLEWSWVSVPALALIFGIGSFGLAYARNGGDALANVDAVLYLDPGSTTRVADSYIGLFAPFRGDYDVTTQGDGLAWGLGGDNGVYGGTNQSTGMRVDEGTPQFKARLYGLQMWSLRTIGLRQHVNVPGQVTASLTLHGNAVSGDVHNGTTLALHDCAIVGADGASRVIPLLLPGQTLRVTPFSLSNGGNSTGVPGGSGGPLTSLYGAGVGGGAGVQAASVAPLASASRYNTILNAIFPTGSIAATGAPLDLIGWSNAPLGQIAVNGSAPRRSDLDLVVAPLNVTIAPGAFILAPGDLPVSVVGTTVQINVGNGGSGLSLNAGDHIDVQFFLPAGGRRLRMQTITLLANLTGGSSSLGASDAKLWNWVSGRWNIIDLSGGTLTLHNAWEYAGPDGRVLLRIAPAQGGVTFTNVDQNLQIGATGRVY